METKEKINRVKEYLDSELVNDNFKELLYNLTQLDNCLTKDNLLRMSGYTDDQIKKVDSAWPEPLRELILNVGCKPMNFAYDYNNNFGSLINVKEKFADYIINICIDKIK